MKLHDGGGRAPVARNTQAKKISANGKPNRKRTCVAPTVPSVAVSSRCIALRAVWPAAASTVKTAQSTFTLPLVGRVAVRSTAGGGGAGGAGGGGGGFAILLATSPPPPPLTPPHKGEGNTAEYAATINSFPPAPCSSRRCRPRAPTGRPTNCRSRRVRRWSLSRRAPSRFRAHRA